MSREKESGGRNGILKEERDHQQILGSYRGSNLNHGKNESGINSSKFTDMFSGILPNISSKFHHSKSQMSAAAPPVPPSIEVSLENKLVTSVMNGGGGIAINSPHDMLTTPDQEPPVQFPTSSNSMMLNTPVRNRQRNNTAPINWGGVSTPPHLTRSDTNYSENSIWSSSNDRNVTNPIMNSIALNNESSNNNSNLTVNNQNNRVRKRSQTLATYNMPQPMMSLPQYPMSNNNNNNKNNNNNNNNNNMMNGIGDTSPHIPMMQDDVDPFSLVWITTNQKNAPHINLAPTLPASNTIAISNIFPIQWNQGWNNIPNLTSVTMATIFSQFGKILSVRTLKGLYMTLIEFESFEHALLAVETMQDKDISIVGAPCKVTFAKILSYSSPGVVDPNSQKKPHSMVEEYIMNGTIQFQAQPNGLQIPIYSDQFNSELPLSVPTTQINRTTTLSAEQDVCPFALPPPPMDSHKDDILTMVKQFDTGNTTVNEDRITKILNHGFTLTQCKDMSDFGSMPEPVLQRNFETPKLREIRKSLDNNMLNELEIEQLALCMLDELPELSLDYLGNTIVQRIYDKCDDLIRDIILRKLKSHLGIFGIHKSGTWVCQKLIKTARMSRHIKFIIEGVEPYCSALFNDQFGNYVIQEVVKFGSQWNQFIFDNILINFWTICINRYGVRAIRACLETSENKIAQEQLIIIASIIVLYSEYLISDHNGTLLITWLLDTSSFQNKYLLLTRHIVPYLSELCCHKLGSLTVLKVLNSRGNDIAKQLIIDNIFNFNDDDTEGAPQATDTLRLVLRDPTLQGSRFIYKMITSRLVLDNEHKMMASQQVKFVLLEEPPRHQHHRLMEEVGLTTTTSNASPRW